MKSDFGKRGGTSPTAGATAAMYEGTLPDGSVARKKSFHLTCPDAFLGCFERGGKWMVSGVTEKPEDRPGQRFVAAKRVK